MTTSSPVAPVTLDRIEAAMKEHGVELARDDSRDMATANLNGFLVGFALLSSVLIVRADAMTDIPNDDPNATLYLAANQVNSTAFGARAVVVNRTEKLVVRTERELPIAAGLNDEQLSTTLKSAVDAVLASQDAMVTVIEHFEEIMKDINS
ncbi:YbjN domain-containing protein [Corynebacterium breve]|uniref:YbjN domain-containing protein n=1 Tax=Corynebacterium breve TaxID=3049799 RepID=A0ABY8VJG5_9CORY|nr:YbjN domain-containing protein [Corynebacterium breve]WIM68920.1 YbjN domain-containing protein [Corynebacterium breve]